MSTINPFNPGSGVSPPFLAGRKSHLAAFKEMLRSIEDDKNENRLVVGLRGTGKTVLLDEFYKVCIENNFLPIRRSQFSRKHCDPVEFTKAIKYDVRTTIESFSKIGKFKGTLASIGSFLKPKKVGLDLFYYEPSYDSTSRVPLEDHLKKYFINNWRIFKNSNYKGVIFLYDEFHTVYDVSRNRWFVLSDFIGVLNEVQNKGCKYFLVFSGLPNLHLNITKARSYTERMFTTINVKNLSKQEAQLAITKPLEKSDYQFNSNLVKKLIEDTGSYPYFIQFYCRELVSNSSKKNVTLNDYERVKPIIVKQLEDDFFDPRMEKLSDDERKVLFAMSKETQEDIKFDSIKKHSMIPRTTLSKLLQRLEEKGLVFNYKRAVYRFSVPMLREYLVRKS